MCLQCPQSFPKRYQKWITVITLMGHPKCTTLGHFGHIVQVHFEFYWLGTL